MDTDKYNPLRGRYSLVAELAGCSSKYVNLVLNGHRDPKTDRACKAIKVLNIADDLLQAINKHNNPNT